MDNTLSMAYEAWNNSASLRSRRSRYKRFTYGDQWSDMVMEGDTIMTAADRARHHGRRPMTNNLLRRLVKSVIGRYRYRREETGFPKGNLADIYTRNDLMTLDCRSLEEFLISGCTIQRIARENTLRGNSLRVDMVSPERFFVNTLYDPRGWDVELVGMLHDWSLGETLLRLADGNNAQAALIIRLFASQSPDLSHRGSSLGQASSTDFFNASPGRCRIIEVWTLDTTPRLRCHDLERATFFNLPLSANPRVEAINSMRRRRGKPQVNTRWESAALWTCSWYAPDGTLIKTSRGHQRHPFHFRMYPMIDGEVHSLVEDVIDQQIYINELISLIDHVVSCAAKGVLLFPSDEKLPSMSWEEIAKTWSSPDAIIPIKGKGNVQPHQVNTQGGNLGARELLATQMQMFEDISGVTNALMGRSSSGNIGAEHYENQVKNAIIALADILDTFTDYITERDNMLKSAT